MDQDMMASFMSISGSSAEEATQFLELTNWNLDEAVNIFLESGGTGGQRGGASSSALPSSSHNNYVDEVRAPDASRNQRLIGGGGGRGMGMIQFEDLLGGMTSASAHPPINDPFRNLAAEAVASVRGSATSHRPDHSSLAIEGSTINQRLNTLFMPPTHLLFQGSFSEARQAAKHGSKWLLVNIQDPAEFASHMLNRDTWSHDALQLVMTSSFVFWQAYHSTDDGRKFTQLYHIQGDASLPFVGVLDPRTGQKMCDWKGFVTAEDLILKLTEFGDQFTQQAPSRASSHPPPAAPASEVLSTDTMTDEEQLAAAIAASLETTYPIVIDDVSDDEASEAEDEQHTGIDLPREATMDPVTVNPVEVLSEEPAVTAHDVTRVQIRLPEGNKLVRRVLKTDPIQLLFIFVRTMVPNASTTKFQLRTLYPPKSLVETLDVTIADEGLMNGTLVLQWEL